VKPGCRVHRSYAGPSVEVSTTRSAGGGTVLFAGPALASGLSSPQDPTKFSPVQALLVIALGVVSTAYVVWVVPRLPRAAAVRRVAARATGEPARRARASATPSSSLEAISRCVVAIVCDGRTPLGGRA
jgi:hypothetical protein